MFVKIYWNWKKSNFIYMKNKIKIKWMWIVFIGRYRFILQFVCSFELMWKFHSWHDCIKSVPIDNNQMNGKMRQPEIEKSFMQIKVPCKSIYIRLFSFFLFCSSTFCNCEWEAINSCLTFDLHSIFSVPLFILFNIKLTILAFDKMRKLNFLNYQKIQNEREK